MCCTATHGKCLAEMPSTGVITGVIIAISGLAGWLVGLCPFSGDE